MSRFRHAVVTGAGRGIGREMALLLADRGVAVTVLDVDAAAARRVAAEVEVRGVASGAIACDIRDAEALQVVAIEVEAARGPVDLLVNNAGIFVGGASLATPQEAITRAFDVNLRGTMNGCAAFVPGMVARGRGQVLNVASLAGWMALPQMGIYSASKAAVIAYSEVLAAELSATGVGVSLLCPSFVDTELVARGQSSDDLRAFGGWLLRGLGQSPREVARAGIDAAFAGRAVAVPARSGALALAIKRRAPARFAQATAFAARLLGRMGLSPGRPTNLAQAGTGAGSRPVDPRIDGVAPALQHMGA